MKYFLHDTSAFQDEKITELFMAHGYEGLGLFYTILEKLAHQEKPVKTAVLKKQLSVGKKLEKCWAFLEETDLISSNNGETFNENLLKFSEKYQVSKEKNRERVAQWREKQALTKDVTDYVPVSNAPKVKISKDKPLPDSPSAESDGLGFDSFWNSYAKKTGPKTKLAGKWRALPADVRKHILTHLNAYRAFKTQNGPQYMPDPQTFLNGKYWESEDYIQRPASKPLPAPPKEFPSDPRDLWGFNDPAPMVQEPIASYASGQHTSTFR